MESHFGSYVSCIKIANQPIIPPLLDDQRREEMRYYRQLAVSLENRKKKRSSSDNEVMISCIEGLALQEDLHEPKPEPQTPTNDVLPFTNSEEPVYITRERSNSYTLEAPSPVLLAFIKSLQNNHNSNDISLHEIFVDKKHACDEINQPSTPTYYITEQLTIADLETDEQAQTKSSKRKLWDIDQAKNTDLSQPMSLPNSDTVSPIVLKRSYKSDDGVSYNENYLTSDDYEYMENIELSSINDEVASKSLQVRESSHSTPNKLHENDSFGKDFCLLDTSLNISRDVDACRESTFSDCSSVSLNKFIPSFDKKSSESHEAEYEAFSYFKEQLKIKHRQQLALLLQEQQREHDLLKEQFQKISRPSSCSKFSPSTPVRPFSRDTFTKKPSPNKRTSPFVLDDSIPTQIPIPSSALSPNKKIGDGKIHKAASIINAGVRGYLTRRLFKTSRVVLLVQTIKDCLVTAMSLQNEINLGLSELDLQNRLLQQLTTACNELNDIFSLSIKDRMAIIAEDREKKKREFKRGHTPLPLSEATRRSLQRKLTSSAPSGERKQYRKRCKSASSVHSDSSNLNQPSQRRPLSSSSFSHKYSVAQPNRKPWR